VKYEYDRVLLIVIIGQNIYKRKNNNIIHTIWLIVRILSHKHLLIHSRVKLGHVYAVRMFFTQ